MGDLRAYLQAFQQKYANDQAANPDIGQILASSFSQGTTAAVNQFAKEKETQKQRAWEGYQQYTKDKKLVSVSNQNEEAPLDAILQINEMVAKGKYKMKGENDGSLILADAKGTPLYKWVSKNDYNLQAVKDIPEGMEVTGYDAKGMPLVRKVKDVGAEIETFNQKQLLKGKPKAQKELINNIGEADILRDTINEALQAAQNIPTGLVGRATLNLKELAGSNDPVLGDLQTVKTALGKLQLMNLQFTKGAVSDREMEFFADTIGNGKVQSLPRMITSFQRALKDIDMREKSAFNTYQSTYGEDPAAFLVRGRGSASAQQTTETPQQTPANRTRLTPEQRAELIRKLQGQ